MITIECGKCTGTGVEQHGDAFDCDAQGTLTRETDRERMADGATFGEIYPCTGCNGFRVMRARGGAYKTRANADAGIATRKASECWLCTAGFRIRTTVNAVCFACSGVGQVPIWAPGDVLPDAYGTCDSMSPESSAVFARDVVIMIERGATMSWGEAHLGLGSLWSCVDYGTAVQMTDVALTAVVRDKLASDQTQWIKIIDAETRAATDILVVQVSPNGYSVKAANVGQRRPMLPPAYTDEAMARPVD